MGPEARQVYSGGAHEAGVELNSPGFAGADLQCILDQISRDLSSPIAHRLHSAYAAGGGVASAQPVPECRVQTCRETQRQVLTDARRTAQHASVRPASISAVARFAPWSCAGAWCCCCWGDASSGWAGSWPRTDKAAGRHSQALVGRTAAAATRHTAAYMASPCRPPGLSFQGPTGAEAACHVD